MCVYCIKPAKNHCRSLFGPPSLPYFYHFIPYLFLPIHPKYFLSGSMRWYAKKTFFTIVLQAIKP